jgi:glycosyltransferase involved in cell wall biosynthesis
MKIGVMARTLDDGDGVGIATTNLIDKIIGIDRNNEYTILFRSPKHLGRYEKYSNVKEILVHTRSKFVWDQVVVPYLAWRERTDVIFCAKYTVPLLARCPTVVMNHGIEYYTLPHFYEWHDLIYVKTFLPLYYKKASKVVAISNDLKTLLHRYVQVPYDKMKTIYYAASERYFRRNDEGELAEFRAKYNLPKDFILTATKVWRGKKRSNRKNIDNIVRAFLTVRTHHPSVKLVIAGEDCHSYIAAVFGKDIADDAGLVYPGWIPQEEMPYLYSLARLLVFPSYSESFGLPLVEAMACGCPVVTSSGGACPEIVGDAAIVVEPADIEGISKAINSILLDRELWQTLSEKGLNRAADFSWAASAESIIEICKEVVSARKQISDEDRTLEIKKGANRHVESSSSSPERARCQ